MHEAFNHETLVHEAFNHEALTHKALKQKKKIESPSTEIEPVFLR